MAALFKADKDSADVLDYQLNWQSGNRPGLAVGETIVTSTWYADTGITIGSDTNTDTTSTVWLSGGTTGKKYVVTNHVVTSDGREYDQSIHVTIRDH